MDLTPSDRDTMRAMTIDELQTWCGGQLPCCGGQTYERGPRGGISINLRCPRCDMRINVIDPDSIWATVSADAQFGQVIREPIR